MLDFLSPKRVKLICYVMSALFLMVHIAMYLIFTQFGVKPMAIFNIFSMVFYCVMLILIKMDRLHVFVVSTFLEICLHMGLAEYFTGWNGGFQVTLIGICVLLFYSEYMARTMHHPYTRSLILAPFAIAAYMVPLLLSSLRPAPYKLPGYMELILQIAWAAIVFVVMLPILHLFVSTATHSQEMLANRVLHDRLTGLPNRYYMSNFFGSMATDNKEIQYWIAIADLDDFKHINDTYGHNCGDYVLVTLGRLIRELSPDIEYCRWGGEEFLLAGERSNSDPESLLRKLCREVEAYPFEYNGQRFRLTVTIGASWFVSGQSIDEWIDKADRKLYEGKSSGKNRTVI